MKNRLKEVRINAKKEQKEVANFLGVTPTALSYYENGKRKPKPKIWKKLADYYGVSVLYLQGVVYGKKEFCDIAIKIIHNYYFMNYKWVNKISSQDNKLSTTDIVGHSKFYEEVDTFIKLKTNGQGKLPYEFYGNDEKEFKITSNIKEYWLELFSDFITKETDLFNLFSSKTMKQKFEEVMFISSFADKLTTAINNLRKQVNVTGLGYMFKERLSEKEKALHNNALDAIQFYDLSDAKKAIDEYSKFINELKNKVNSFDEIEYFKDYILNTVIPFKRFNSPDELNTWYDIITKEVKNNNKELIQLIANNDNGNLINLYQWYQLNKTREKKKDKDDN